MSDRGPRPAAIRRAAVCWIQRFGRIVKFRRPSSLRLRRRGHYLNRAYRIQSDQRRRDLSARLFDVGHDEAVVPRHALFEFYVGSFGAFISGVLIVATGTLLRVFMTINEAPSYITELRRLARHYNNGDGDDD